MKDKNKMLIAVMASAVVIVMVASFLMYSNSNNDSADFQESDMEGYWILVQHDVYDNDGNYESWGPDDIRTLELCMDIYYTDYGQFYGWYDGVGIAGTCTSDLITSQIRGDGYDAWMTGTMYDNNTMCVSFVTYYDDGNIESSSSLYTKDGTIPEYNNNTDISGDWDCTSAIAYTSENTEELTRMLLNIIQTEGVFTGTMEETTGTSPVMQIRGAFDPSTNDGPVTGHFEDSSGHLWTFKIENGTLTTWNCSMLNTESVTEEPACIVRTYTQGGAIPAADKQIISLEGSTWNCTYFDYIDGTDSTSATEPYTFTISSQYGNVIIGTIHYNDLDIDAVGYLYGENIVEMDLFVSSSYNSDLTYGIFTTDQEMYLIDIEKTYSARMTFELETDEAFNIEGHWFNTVVTAYDQNGDYQNVTEDSNYRQPYDLEIYSVDGDLFYGSYNGNYISGIYADNTLYFNAEVDRGYSEIICQVIDSQTMLSSQAFYNSETNYTDVWSVILKKEYTEEGSAPVITYEDFSGEWNLVQGTVYDGESTETPQGTKLNITEITGNVFIGTMQQDVDGVLYNKVIKGVVYSAETTSDGSMINGIIVDENGLFWHMYILNGMMFLYTATVSDGAGMEDTLVSAERIYTRDGTGILPRPDHDLEGTDWLLVSREIMTSSGDYSVGYDETVTFSVISQERSLFSATITDGEIVLETMGYLQGDTFRMMTSSDDLPNISTGMFIDDEHIMMYSFFEDDTTGEYQAVVSVYEKI
ncbi:MAG: hypothetical protein M0P07_01070 [Candidatus Methanomethylophilaceae archaeon]|nr:hypothetical protein [Candidatus Cloacimonadota bacterium]MCK9322543.1 hypothetical protein [Candidatus Methanomethylophilaceae archaeon]